MGSCKSQTSSRALDRCMSSMEECLPLDMLEAVLGKLDREALCTARLVSRAFCAAASANISSLTLSSPSQAVSLERFPHLGHVTVHQTGNNDSLAELDPRLCGVITHLTVSRGEPFDVKAFPDLPEVPKLRELDVDVGMYPIARVDGAAVLHCLTNLEVIRIGGCTPSVAMTITTTTWLTSLVIGLVRRPGEGWGSAEVSWLQHATNLRHLQALHINVFPEGLPLIGNLTGLTWSGRGNGPADSYSIAPLSRLSRLRSLDIGPDISENDLAIAGSLASGCLAKLRLKVAGFASDDCGRLLARQTALTWLGLGSNAQLCNLRTVAGLRVELLQSLELPWVNRWGPDGLDVLQRATSLTKLHIGWSGGLSQMFLGRSLGRLTQLRCLELRAPGCIYATNALNYALALGPLTALTKLRISRGYLENGDLRALLGLTGLRLLYLVHCRLTDEVVPELGVLTNLTTLSFVSCGVTSLAPATNILNPLRQARGWPPVNACCC